MGYCKWELTEKIWDLEWCYFPPERICLSFWSMSSNQNNLNWISRLEMIWMAGAGIFLSYISVLLYRVSTRIMKDLPESFLAEPAVLIFIRFQVCQNFFSPSQLLSCIFWNQHRPRPRETATSNLEFVSKFSSYGSCP